MDNEASSQLEALMATFQDSCTTSTSATGLTATLVLRPFPHADNASFVQVTLKMQIDAKLSIFVTATKGIGDSRRQELLDLIERNSVDGALFVAGSVQDWLTLNNWPDGRCSICLEELNQQQRSLLAPCGCAFHFDCFRLWYDHFQVSAAKADLECI